MGDPPAFVYRLALCRTNGDTGIAGKACQIELQFVVNLRCDNWDSERSGVSVTKSGDPTLVQWLLLSGFQLPEYCGHVPPAVYSVEILIETELLFDFHVLMYCP